jgi:hypothetical protein
VDDDHLAVAQELDLLLLVHSVALGEGHRDLLERRVRLERYRALGWLPRAH